ncbi:MAG: XRE family transcriptional regulator [Candidatus Cloacimonetes bacterium]|nr:XRE family transcriptional regulator [Candidatus Cloacimonadota bacterium]MDY0367548.1 XRE family transcriptional regulator [Candidatus Syntrophosphaera sp.]
MKAHNEGLAQRLKLVRTSVSATQKKLSEVLGCSQAKVSDYESGKLSISNIDLSKIANTYNINLNWLITGEGQMYNNVRAREGSIDLLRLPVLGDIAAGVPFEFVQDEANELLDVPATLLTLPPPYWVFRVDGESMLPVIQPGDYVVLSTNWHGIKLDGRVCAFRTADGITLKQYVLDHRHRTAWLWPINSSYKPVAFNRDTDDCALIAVLVLSIRKYI